MSTRLQDNHDEPDADYEFLEAEARRYKHAVISLVETIRKNTPEETLRLIEAIRNTKSVPEAAELVMQLPGSGSPSGGNVQGGTGAGTRS
ncbi:uncharacterized protein DSM5745_05190 [Aspergillus mulundensis]|uniref:Uncharacterized protein n=1 Tax=Aspergillus mulundensis TaxID=1810919 RepID=A0A3D8S5P7_9EURO|nr:Uncharacterized protein DSM5745_05190 [Aspergillus mulundensis]RDW81633.1 Uncharacterized protein DSM5745_05190 [Aspergillus mulundensis]